MQRAERLTGSQLTAVVVALHFDELAVGLVLQQPVYEVVPYVVPHAAVAQLHGVAVLRL